MKKTSYFIFCCVLVGFFGSTSSFAAPKKCPNCGDKEQVWSWAVSGTGKDCVEAQKEVDKRLADGRGKVLCKSMGEKLGINCGGSSITCLPGQECVNGMDIDNSGPEPIELKDPPFCFLWQKLNCFCHCDMAPPTPTPVWTPAPSSSPSSSPYPNPYPTLTR